MSTYSILLVEGSGLIRRALNRLIEDLDITENCNAAGDVSEAVAIAKEHPPHVIISSLSLPGPSGIELAYELGRREIDTPVIILTRKVSPELKRQAQRAGISQLLSKNVDELELVTAIQQVAEEPPAVRASMRADADPLAILSSREREVFHLLVEGQQNASIAKLLHISPRTVETHRARIVQKLGVKTNADLIRFAITFTLAAP